VRVSVCLVLVLLIAGLVQSPEGYAQIGTDSSAISQDDTIQVDKVFIISVLQNMPEPKKTILEMKRVNKLEASFVVTGLKKKFGSESFCELLKKARLEVVMFNDDEQLKGYVVVCVNV